MAHVCRLGWKDLDVVRRIIEFVAVDVMDNFAMLERTAELGFSNDDMLVDVAIGMGS